jgi:hypothetical protein
LGWGITAVIVALLYGFALFWNIQKTKQIASDADPYGSSSDCFSARILFLLVLTTTVLSLIYFVVYKFATIAGDNHLSQYFLASHDSERLVGYHTYLADKATWLNFLSVINVIIGLHTCFTLFTLTGSPVSVRIYLNTYLLVFTVVSWLLIRQHGIMSKQLPSPLWNGTNSIPSQHKTDISDEWSYNLVNAFSIAAIPLAGLLILANNYKLKNGSFILGTVLLLLIALTVTAVGYISRDYRVRIKHYSDDTTNGNNWRNEVCKIDRKFLEGLENNRKYIYKNYDLCPARTLQGVYECVENPSNYPGRTTPQCVIWENSIIPNGAPPSQNAIVNERMRGVVTLLFTRPVLTYITLGLAWIFVGFIITAYTFYLSSREKGTSNTATLNYIFLALFVLFLIVAFIFSGLNPAQAIPFDTRSTSPSPFILDSTPYPRGLPFTHPKGEMPKHNVV